MLCGITRVAMAAFLWAGLAGQPEAASVRGSANATVVGVTGTVSSLIELQRALGVLTTSTVTQDAGTSGPVLSQPAPRPQVSGGQAAQVSIGGVPNQTFALSVTDQLVTVTESGELLVTKFSHNAGVSPLIGPDGTALIDVGIEESVGSAEDLDSFETAAGRVFGENLGLIEVTIPTVLGSQTLTIQRPDHFGPNLFGETFFTILVSYN